MNSTIIILLLLVLPFQREVVRYLIDSGADPEIKKLEGNQPSHNGAAGHHQFPEPLLNWDKRKMVEPTGLEPATPTMPLWCSTN